MKRVFLAASLLGISTLAYLRCSQPEYRAHIFDYQASAGCRAVHSCSSCGDSERCDVTSRDPEGWPTARECCPK